MQVEKSYYLGPDKGGDKAYSCLVEAMRHRRAGRGRALGGARQGAARADAAVRKDGLILHQLYYANEVRTFDEIDLGRDVQRSATWSATSPSKLIDQLASDAFEPSKYQRRRTRARARRRRAEGRRRRRSRSRPKQPQAQIIDLFEALKQSLAEAKKPPGSRPSLR